MPSPDDRRAVRSRYSAKIRRYPRRRFIPYWDAARMDCDCVSHHLCGVACVAVLARRGRRNDEVMCLECGEVTAYEHGTAINDEYLRWLGRRAS